MLLTGRCQSAGDRKVLRFAELLVSGAKISAMAGSGGYTDWIIKRIRHLIDIRETSVAAIEKDLDRAWNNYPKGFVAYLQPGDVPPGGQGLARYLAKYVVSPPIAVRRIEQYDGPTVRYWYQDHKTEAIQHETLPVLRFIGRMVQHILPKGFFLAALPSFVFNLNQDFNFFSLGLGDGRALNRRLLIQGGYVHHIAGRETFNRALQIGITYLWGQDKSKP